LRQAVLGCTAGMELLKKCVSETEQKVLVQEIGKRNGDWYDGECISIGQEKDAARMKLLSRNTRQNRELYKQKRREACRLYRRKKRKKINKQIADIQNQNSSKEYRKFYNVLKN